MCHCHPKAVKVFNEIFPQGCLATTANIQRLLDTEEWGFCAFERMCIPINGHFSVNGAQYWYRDGKPHRDNGPAVIFADGAQYWYRDGKLHRDDGPACVNGAQYWYRDGKLHRDDGPAVIFADGAQHWYRDGKLHRDDGPAITFNPR